MSLGVRDLIRESVVTVSENLFLIGTVAFFAVFAVAMIRADRQSASVRK